jgi:hypothetical protein
MFIANAFLKCIGFICFDLLMYINLALFILAFRYKFQSD